ncbi:checkpoint protein HUS1 [Drosophila tropicalis]|uniref:checkpoint protein HUS1 n=1 Tax=Drosophila tropicalis TaxID=46794 RepID=UPI0035AB9348
MKFRALMQDPLYMREFQSIIATLAKLAKDCLMILEDQKIHFIVNEEHSSTASPLVWTSIASQDYFPEYLCEPAREEHGYIVLQMSAAHLSRSLAVLRMSNVNNCKMKLQRIQFPCISVIASVVSATSCEPREVVHDVPATIVPFKEWPPYLVPRVPSSQLVLNIPSLRLMRSLIEKLKNISPSLVFHASSAGELNLVAESEMATITTRFKRLLQSILVADQNGPKDASCSVDTRKASAFFGALQLPNEELIIGIDPDHSIHLQMDIRENVVLHSILPAVCV